NHDRPEVIEIDSDSDIECVSSSDDNFNSYGNDTNDTNDTSTSTHDQTFESPIDIDTPILPENYPPPLPPLCRDLYNLTFTHRTCADFVVNFNAGTDNLRKSYGMHTITNGVMGDSRQGNVASFVPVYDNEVSEFVGDSIIGMVVALLLRKWYPHLRPDGLTEIRSKLVNRGRLSSWAKLYNFDQHLILPPQMPQLPVRLSPMVLCDTFEAYVASVFDQQGDESAGLIAVKQWIEPLCRPYADMYSAAITNREKEVREAPRMGSMGYLNQMMEKHHVVAAWTESGGVNDLNNSHNYWSASLNLTLDERAHNSTPLAVKSKFPLTTTGKASKKKVAKEMAAYKALKTLGLNYCGDNLSFQRYLKHTHLAK
ncbi:hypothetical protein E3P96_02924, partial [Wallemia ichthyophaga]